RIDRGPTRVHVDGNSTDLEQTDCRGHAPAERKPHAIEDRGSGTVVRMPRTMFDKIWDAHVVTEGPGGQTLLYVDRHLLHEGSTSAFTRLERSGRRARRPERSFATADHYLPTTPPGTPIVDAEVRGMIAGLARHVDARGITHFGVGDARRGIVHVIGP